MKKHLALFAMIALAASATAQTITAISPNTAEQGTSGLTVTFTLSSTMLPPPDVLPTSITIGSVSGTSYSHAVQGTVTALFDIPFSLSTGAQDAVVEFTDPQGQPDIFSMTGGFTVTAGPDTAPVITEQPASKTAYLGYSTTLSISAYGSDPLTYQWQKGTVGIAGATGASYSISEVTESDAGNYLCTVSNEFGSETSATATLTTEAPPASSGLSYPIVDTNQDGCFDDNESFADWPDEGEDFYGQDAQYVGITPAYGDNNDGTVSDLNTGLMWAQEQSNSTMGWNDAFTYCDSLTTGGYDDWRLPTLKELWSIRDFSTGWPWIDTSFFYLTGDGTQMNEHHSWTSNPYLVESPYQDEQVEGDPAWIVNDWTGHIKAMSGNRFVRPVRGNTTYGINEFVDNGDGTVTDNASGLMWAQDDSGEAMFWKEALAYAEAATTAGYSDWRLPNIKELQSIADNSVVEIPAMDTSVFNLTQVENIVYDADTQEQIATQINYPFYWSGTSNPIEGDGSEVDGGTIYAWIYATGYNVNMLGYDLHGAGSIVFVSKSEEHIGIEDSVPVMVRLVRTALATDDSVGDGIPNAWRAEHFGGTGTTTTPDSAAGADPDGDGCNNLCEYLADTDPNDPNSRFVAGVTPAVDSVAVSFQSSADRVYTLWRSADLSDGSWETVAGQVEVVGSGGIDTLTDSDPPADHCFYLVEVFLPD